MVEEKTMLELVELERAIVNTDNLYLDPNNPRFLTEFKEPIATIPLSRIKEQKVQSNLINRLINEIKIDDIVESIIRYGFNNRRFCISVHSHSMVFLVGCKKGAYHIRVRVIEIGIQRENTQE